MLFAVLKRITLVWLGTILAFAINALPVSQGDILTTTFASNNGQAGNMFDINVLSPTGINVEELALNLDVGTWNVQLFTLNASYAGNETNSGVWTLRESLNGLTSTAANAPTLWNVNDFFLDQGTEAFYIRVANGTAMNYTNGTVEGSLVAGDANLQIFQGTGNAGFFGQQFRPRIWNGSITYSVAIPEAKPQLLLLATFCCLGVYRRREHPITSAAAA